MPPPRLLTFLLLVTLFAPKPLRADEGSAQLAPAPSCAQRVASRVQHHYESVRDLSARFEQTVHSVMGGPGAIARSSGRVVFSKPGKMRWSYEEPRPSEVISDGNTLWLYDPAAREVQKFPVTQGYLAGAGLQFLLGEGRLDQDFSISARECGGEGQSSVELELIPLQPASYERIRLLVLVDSGEVRETIIVDLFGNETRIAFHELRLNRDPPAETFRFEVPEGVDVIDLEVSK